MIASIFKEAINFTTFNIKRDTSGSVPDLQNRSHARSARFAKLNLKARVQTIEIDQPSVLSGLE